VSRKALLATVSRTLAWVLVGALSGVALIRLFRSESVPLFIGVQGISEWLLLPAYPFAIVAVYKRKKVLGAVAVVLALSQALLAANIFGFNGEQAPPTGTTGLTLVTANVLNENPHIRALGDEIEAVHADFVLMQEVTPEVVAVLHTSALWNAYPYHQLSPHPGFDGAAIFSEYPITAGREIAVAGFPMLQVDVETPAGGIRIVDVHTVAPLSGAEAATWRNQFAALQTLAAAAHRPLVLAGDFNATLDHAPLERLVASGMRDAFVAAGSGFGLTWPRLDAPVAPAMRLDHVLVSESISVVSLTEQTSTGSDHRRLVARLALAPER
jgi:endonuclease/exonuclease/phosphatase (EEP) superfamily protein YafD